MCLKDRFKSAILLRTELRDYHQVDLSAETIRRRLREVGLFGRRPAKKPMSTKKMKATRLAWAKKYQNWTKEDWRRVIWSDESKFNLLCADNRPYVRRSAGERFKKECTIKTVKFPQSQMVWGCFSFYTLGPLHFVDGTINAQKYGQFIKEFLIPSIEEHLSFTYELIFQDDSAPCHGAKSVASARKHAANENLSANLSWGVSRTEVSHERKQADSRKVAVVDTVSELSEPPPSPTTPPYQRLTKALHTDPRCAHEVALGRRVGLYRFCGDIGRGNFSKVKLAVHQLTRDKVAIKVVDRGGLDARALRMLSREVATLECVHHPNILRLFEVVETLGRVYLVTEWVRGGELYNHITQGGPLREVHAAPLYKQLLLAVKHMHSLGFVHRDIKAENVLLVSESRLKLADFGFSTELINGHNQKLDTFCGSPPYAAPELFSDDHYAGGPVDVWALGVLLYFMVVGNMPFRAPTVPALRVAVLKGDYSIPGHLSLPCIRLIQRVLVHMPARRPSVEEMLSSQWIMNPNLSVELMLQQLTTNSKTAKKSFWFRTKPTRRIGRAYSLRERYLEISNKAPSHFNTKRNDGILVDNFLHPIDLTNEPSVNEQPSSISKKSFLCGTLKKKIGPMEAEKEKGVINGDLSSAGEHIRKGEQHMVIELQTLKNYDEEKGQFIMIPTDTDELNKLNPLEVEGRELLEKLGVTSEMLRGAILSGPRSELIGAYRIIINRLQKQAWLAKKQSEAALQEPPKTTKRSRTCTIL